jgi:PIN domain nuclease of toxin-antitoxin system
VWLLLDTAVLFLRSRVTTTTHKTRDHSIAKCRKHPRTERISLSEIAIKAARGKLGLSEPDARRTFEDLNLRTLPYTAHHAFSLFDLPPHHQDPQIIAQAACEKIPVVTCDGKFSLQEGTQCPLVIRWVCSQASPFGLPVRPDPHEALA